MNGKIICINASIHRVLLENNTIVDTKVRGKIRNMNIAPVVGDNVIVNKETNTIEKILPRKNCLDRPLVSNIDKLLIVMSTSIPVFSSYLIDKFLLIAASNNIEPVKASILQVHIIGAAYLSILTSLNFAYRSRIIFQENEESIGQRNSKPKANLFTKRW